MSTDNQSSLHTDKTYLPPAQELESISKQRFRELQQENLRLKCLVAEQALYIRELEELFCR